MGWGEMSSLAILGSFIRIKSECIGGLGAGDTLAERLGFDLGAT